MWDHRELFPNTWHLYTWQPQTLNSPGAHPQDVFTQWTTTQQWKDTMDSCNSKNDPQEHYAGREVSDTMQHTPCDSLKWSSRAGKANRWRGNQNSGCLAVGRRSRTDWERAQGNFSEVIILITMYLSRFSKCILKVCSLHDTYILHQNIINTEVFTLMFAIYFWNESKMGYL